LTLSVFLLVIASQEKAKELGLWNLWLPNDTAAAAGGGYTGAGLTNLQYANLCEIMGTANHMEFCSEVCNCASPDTGNMETLARFANEEQKAQWLRPLLDGKIRSCFAMTEPDVASSDATNISISIDKDHAKGQYVINGKKWWITGAGSLHCQIMILMGKTDPNGSRSKQQSMILVPMNTPGITLLRPMSVIGDDEAPKGHMEILFEDVRVPFENILAGEGRGFEIAQARLGPGRVHHCMRLLGTAERALSLMCKRSEERVAFGKKLNEFDTILQDIARSRYWPLPPHHCNSARVFGGTLI
jgi:alkylation response protein AidB-like acyl-CoA dehydrogenase